MARTKITEPISISFGISIAVPIHNTTLFFKDREAKYNIYKCEEYFITEREKADDPVEKRTLTGVEQHSNGLLPVVLLLLMQRLHH